MTANPLPSVATADTRGLLARTPGGGSWLIDRGTAMGHVVWLMAHSPLHAGWRLREIARLVYPAILRGQLLVYYDDQGLPLAFVTWAFLTPEAETGFEDGTRRLMPNDWDAGDRFWLIDFVAPFGRAGPLVRDLAGRVFGDQPTARSLRRHLDGSTRRRNLWRNRRPGNARANRGRMPTVREVFHDAWGDSRHIGLFDGAAETVPAAADRADRARIGLLGLRPGASVLDVGCGFGHTVRLLAGEFGCPATGVDVAAWRITRAAELTGDRPGVTLRQADCQDLPFPDGSFDHVLATESLSYVADPDAALAECLRVLKPGGRLVVSDFWIGDNGDRAALADATGCASLTGLPAWRQRIADAGGAALGEDDWTRHQRATYVALRDAFAHAHGDHHSGRVAIRNMDVRIDQIDRGGFGYATHVVAKREALARTLRKPLPRPSVTLVMMSGGVDSVYALWALLTGTDDTILVHHINFANAEGRHSIEALRSRQIVDYLSAKVRPFNYSESTIDHRGLAWFGYDIVAVGFEAGLIAHSYLRNHHRPVDRWTIGTCREEGHWQGRFRHVEACCAANCFPHPPPDFFLLPPIPKQEQIARLPEELVALTWGCRHPVLTHRGIEACAICTTCRRLIDGAGSGA